MLYIHIYVYLYTLRWLLCLTDQTYSIQYLCMCRYTVYDGRGSQQSKQRESAASYPYMWSVDETHVVSSCLHRFFFLQILSGQYCLNCLLLVSLKWSKNFTFGGCLTPPVSLTRVHSASSCVQMEPHSKHARPWLSSSSRQHHQSLPVPVQCIACRALWCGLLHWWYWASCTVIKQMFHPFDPRVQVGWEWHGRLLATVCCWTKDLGFPPEGKKSIRRELKGCLVTRGSPDLSFWG